MQTASEHEWDVDYGYLALLSELANSPEATPRHDRTGVGTFSLFGKQLKHDLSRSFPLLTTKKVPFKTMTHELLWMLSGDTNVKTLQEKGVTIWDEWADELGELGPIYSHQWRNWGGRVVSVPRRQPRLRSGVPATYLRVGNGAGKEGHPLSKTWEGMMARCYDPNSSSYPNYGARGVVVCDAWLEFSKFAEDAPKLPGWVPLSARTVRHVLDKDMRGDGFLYSPETCVWTTDRENAAGRSRRRYTVEKDGQQYTFTNISEFCEAHGVEAANFSDLWTGRKNAQIREGFRLIGVEDLDVGVDQIKHAQYLLRNNPQSRRIIVSAWNVADLEKMALSPCHAFFQFYSRHVTGQSAPHLDLHLYQRSADIFLGVPFNIASYALLTHMMAHTTGHRPGRLYISFGDVHLYTNHALAALTQLKRAPVERASDRPQLEILTSTVKCITEFKAEDFAIVNYHPWPAIPAPVAV